MPNHYLDSAKNQFMQYRALGEKAMAQVPDEKIGWQPSPESNSLGSIVKHVSGNMRSRFTDFLSTDGEKPWRNRESEFDNDVLSREQLMTRWQAGWTCLLSTLEDLSDEDLNKSVLIRKEPHSVLEAINRQLAHVAYHVGQIVFLARIICGSGWTSLSIPRGFSDRFNAEKFGEPK